MNTTEQTIIDFLYSQLKERFNNVSTFKPIKVNESKTTNWLNAFSMRDITVSVITYDANPESDDANYTRIVNYKGLIFQF